MKKPATEIEYKATSEIKELPGNPRTIKKDQFEKLKASIKANADYFEARPLILSDRTGELVVIAGNQRLKAAKALNIAEVPTVTLHGLTEKREREIIIRDNVNNGDWDMDALANEWDTSDLEDWGVELPDIGTEKRSSRTKRQKRTRKSRPRASSAKYTNLEIIDSWSATAPTQNKSKS